MNQSANISVRLRRMSQTRMSLISHARRLTAQHGLAGFTVEELCELVGVSRRTFFNYFASKEDAVIGRADEALDERLLLAFAFSPPAGEHLLDELANLVVRLFDTVGITPTEAAEFAAALDREPRLFAALMRSSDEHDQRLIEVVTARERFEPADPAAAVAVAVVSAVTRLSALAFFRPDNDLPFADLVAVNLHAARRLLAPTTKERIDIRQPNR